jgi:hypothetical protein
MDFRTNLIVNGRYWVNKLNYTIAKITRRFVYKIVHLVLTNLDLPATIEAVKSSAKFEHEHLIDVPYFKTREQLYDFCLGKAPSEGVFLEFGTYKGDSINIMAKLRPDTHFTGFDSFIGLPERWTTGAKKGAFDIGGMLPEVRDNVTLVKGFFEDSLPGWCKENHDKKVSFIHDDCDLYSGTITIFENLRPMIQSGTIVVFDEYYNYTEWLEGEYKAFIEFTEKYHVKFEYIGYIRENGQVAVRITDIPTA